MSNDHVLQFENIRQKWRYLFEGTQVALLHDCSNRCVCRHRLNFLLCQKHRSVEKREPAGPEKWISLTGERGKKGLVGRGEGLDGLENGFDLITYALA